MIPKEIRDRLALDADAQLEIDTDGDAIRLVPVRRTWQRVIDVDGWPVIERGDAPPITDADAPRWRDADQR